MMDVAFQLGSGERLLWSGKPRQGILLRPSDSFAIPCTLLWCGLCIYWVTRVMASQSPLMLQLWAAPFVVAGLYLVIGRFFTDAASRGRCLYAVTSLRIIIASGLWHRQVVSLPLSTLREIALVESKGDTGSITFGPQHPARRYVPGGWPGASRLGPEFDMIEGARKVYELIRRAQQAAR